MTKYSDYHKQAVYDEMENYCSYYDGTIEDIAEVFKDFISNMYNAQINKRKEELEEEYGEYKSICERMKKMLV